MSRVGALTGSAWIGERQRGECGVVVTSEAWVAKEKEDVQ